MTGLAAAGVRGLAAAVLSACLLALGAPGALAASSPLFSGVGPLNTARSGAVSAPLPDGTALIAGGTTGTSAASAGAELYKPSTRAFAPLSATMSTGRTGAVAASLPDGDVLIAGGQDSGGAILATAELFHPGSGTFSTLATQMISPRVGAAAAPLPNGQILIAGGLSAGHVLTSAEVYDPATGTFMALPHPMAVGRELAAAAPLPTGVVLIAGGADGLGRALRSAEVFNPATQTFSLLQPSMTNVRQAPVAAPLGNGDVLIAGGMDSHLVREASAEVFDPRTGTFTALPAVMAVAREGSSATALSNGQVLIAGGSPGTGRFTPSAEVFQSAAQAAAARVDFGSQTVGQRSPGIAVRVSDVGAQPLTISGMAVSGANGGDFAITSDGCSGHTLAFGQSCTITATFDPSGLGTRGATIGLADNEPVRFSVALVGTGVARPPAKAPPPNPFPRKVVLIRCTTVLVAHHGAKGKTRRTRCRSHQVAAAYAPPADGARATVERGGVVYGSGFVRAGGLVLHVRRPIHRGRYTLVVTRRTGHRTTTTVRPISIA